jgi:hypothetical protein
MVPGALIKAKNKNKNKKRKEKWACNKVKPLGSKKL